MYVGIAPIAGVKVKNCWPELSFWLEICNKLKIPLVLVGDPNQSIYQFQGGSDKFLLNHSNNKYQSSVGNKR